MSCPLPPVEWPPARWPPAVVPQVNRRTGTVTMAERRTPMRERPGDRGGDRHDGGRAE
ncbi:hypothetical protein RVN83_08685 [Streptomyces sp. PU10]|uniref:hypothetical protein n=1 Tax=Streptomyces TaxID=1883 RepID=UPI0013E0A970|nr:MULTISPECIES: hypothetical protein [Streptomyces]MBH5131630.1 hypothetical protein [Streptomyces sp. HB-N217]MDU0253334.1 hypothetical protein [Streptomyces sp. PU10]QKW63900.1 hypothetical protein HUT15_27125 [Streptomyces sp. NA03103]WSU04278.1 hypothetical protein OG368_28265 [Streptomyces sp. NBC_01124]